MADEEAPRSSSPAPLGSEEALSSSTSHDSFLANVAAIPKRQAPEHALVIPRAGDAVGRFVVREEIGRGGMGVVYAADDPTLGREVALKVLFVAEERQKQRLLREARAAATLGYDGIVAIYDVGEDQGRAFIAMERVRGETLRALLEKTGNNKIVLSKSTTKRIARDLARSLGKAHGRGLVHRDLKPENVMVEPEGRVVLLDFGLVKGAFADAESAMLKTEEGALVGTPSYMSPEQALGRPVDARSDVFSFGVMLYEMTTGRRPFVAPNAAALLLAIQRETPQKPSEIVPDVDPGLERLILACLQKDPARRPASGNEIAAALGRSAIDPVRASSSAVWRFVGLVAVLLVSLLVLGVLRATFSPDVDLFPSPAMSVEVSSPLTNPLVTSRVAMSVVDLPEPLSHNKEAISAYRRGLAAIRSGAAWGPEFQRAIALDPTMAAAHVQLAAVSMFQHVDGVRESLNEARLHSDLLSPRDHALLRALEPVVQREPADWAEANKRLTEALLVYEGDAELTYLLALGHASYDDFGKAVELCQRAFELDPGFARALASKALFEAYRGRFDKAESTIELCLNVMPGSLPCLSFQARLEANAGRCASMEATARQMIAKSGEPHIAYPLLAGALASKGEPIATVREALIQAAKGIDALPKGTADLVRDRVLTLGLARVSALGGDFEEALRQARIYESRAALSPRRNEHGAAARAIASILFETGNRAEAGHVALDYLDRQDAWEPDPSAEDLALFNDATPTLLVIAHRAGLLSHEQVVSRRQTWLEAWSRRVTPVARSYLWLYGFATTTLDEGDARAALSVQDRYGSLPSYLPQTMVGASLGVTLFLAGRTGEALTWLERSCRACLALSSPLEHTRAFLSLGRVLEVSGDVRGACNAYQVVLDRWAHAKPRSVSAETAKERSFHLGCEKK